MDNSEIDKNKIYTLMDNKEFDKALKYIDKLLQSYPDNLDSDLINWKGISLYNLEKDEEAFECFDYLVSKFPKTEKFWRNRAITLAESYRYEPNIIIYNMALQSFDMALTIDPNSYHALHRMGDLFAFNDDFEKALYYFKKAKKALKNSPDEDEKAMSFIKRQIEKLTSKPTNPLSTVMSVIQTQEDITDRIPF